ncbi:MAG: hypothetical protein AABW81_02525 [Nanoarchaeota archaeon]
MGFIRGSFAFVVGCVLLFFFLATNLLLTVNLSLKYENISPELLPTIKDIQNKLDTNKLFISFFVSIILVVLMFFLIEDKTSFPLVIGALLVVSSLPFMKINAFFSFFDSSITDFITIFFSKSYTVFLISFILGILILGVGIALKLFGIGLKLNEYFSKNTSLKDKKQEKEKIIIVEKQVEKPVKKKVKR